MLSICKNCLEKSCRRGYRQLLLHEALRVHALVLEVVPQDRHLGAKASIRVDSKGAKECKTDVICKSTSKDFRITACP